MVGRVLPLVSIAWLVTCSIFTILWIKPVSGQNDESVTLIVSTDLLNDKNYGDLDDHFDMPLLYSRNLNAQVGAIHLDSGWLTRHPSINAAPSLERGWGTIRRLEAAYGTTIPLIIGSSKRFAPKGDPPAVADTLHKTIRSLAPVTVVLTGTARDLAWTLWAYPELVSEGLIRSVWVMAGDAELSLQVPAFPEWNAAADPAALSFVIGSGVPIVWIPCFDGGTWQNRGRASHFVARNGELFDGVDPEVKRAMVLAWGRDNSGHGVVTRELESEFDGKMQNMWLSGLLTLVEPISGKLAPLPGIVGVEKAFIAVDGITGFIRKGTVQVDLISIEDHAAFSREMIFRHNRAIRSFPDDSRDLAMGGPR